MSCVDAPKLLLAETHSLALLVFAFANVVLNMFIRVCVEWTSCNNNTQVVQIWYLNSSKYMKLEGLRTGTAHFG